jgi:hypothetical protein
MTAERRQSALVALLRFGGVITFSAFFTIFLPVEWMASTHRWLGLGEFPRSPIVDYLARSVATFYGFHGCLLLLVSTDPVRYRAIVSFIAMMTSILGILLLGIDLHAGLPVWWTAFEGPPVIVVGILIGWLNRK